MSDDPLTAETHLLAEAKEWHQHCVETCVGGHSILKQLIERYESQASYIEQLHAAAAHTEKYWAQFDHIPKEGDVPPPAPQELWLAAHGLLAYGHCDPSEEGSEPYIAAWNRLDAALRATSRYEQVRSHLPTCANVQPGSTYEDVCDCGAVVDGIAVRLPDETPAPRQSDDSGMLVDLLQQCRDFLYDDSGTPIAPMELRERVRVALTRHAQSEEERHG